MSWLEHPRYVPARERLISYLVSPKYRFKRLAPVLFLCGAAASSPRDTLCDYLRKRRPELRLFYAERVWEHIASLGGSALKMESDLALLADLLIVIVESPGAFAELGAFSISDPLRTKLLPIVDKQYATQRSFIATGPLQWIDAESHFKPTIYASLAKILEAVDQIEERISRIPKSTTIKVSDLGKSPKHLLFFLCDLVAVIHPVTIELVEYYIRRIAPSILTSNISVPTLLGLGVAMDLLRSEKTGTADCTYFFPAARDAIERPFHHKRLLDLPSQRADHVSVLLAVPEARAVLEILGRVL